MLRRNAFVGWTVALVLTVSASTPRFALAEKQDARRHYDKATAAFGLGKYLDAATEYEAAFQIKPEPALLYNAAQAYRLAGKEGRAEQLYRNYLRLFADAQNAEDARQHLANLEARATSSALPSQPPLSPPPRASAATAGAKPVVATAPVTIWPAASESPSPPLTSKSRPPPTISLTSAAALSSLPESPSSAASDPMSGASSSSTLTASATPIGGQDDSPRRLTSRPLFWVAVGAAVVVAGASALLLSRGGDKDPQPSLGTVVGN